MVMLWHITNKSKIIFLVSASSSISDCHGSLQHFVHKTFSEGKKKVNLSGIIGFEIVRINFLINILKEVVVLLGKDGIHRDIWRNTSFP